MVRRGLAPSRARARELVEGDRVRVAGAPVRSAARQVAPGEPLTVVGEGPRFVGRGGEKLAAALEAFDLDPTGLRVLDAGASTGGFTDALLQNGAAEVVAVDVGRGQLHDRLRRDPRVVVRERTNLRHVDPVELGPIDAVVVDVSFISLAKVLPVLAACAPSEGRLRWIVALVKPQFEAGRQEVSRGRGVVRDPEVWSSVLVDVSAAAAAEGLRTVDLVPSPLRGADGNVEFLALLRPGPAPDRDELRGLVERAVGPASAGTAT